MDGQDGHPVPVAAPSGGGELGPRVPQPLQAEQKLEQGAAAAVLHLAGQGVEGEQVVLPLLASRHGPEEAQDVGLFVDVPDELAAGAVPRPKAQLLQLVKKVRAGCISVLSGLNHGGIEVPLAPGPEPGQVVGVKAKHRGAQGGDKGHVLPGVVYDLQNGQGHIYLGGGKEVLAPLGVPGDALLPQGTDVVVEDHAGAAEQDHHIAGPQGAHPVPLFDHQRLLQQGADAPGHEPGF